MAMDRVTFEYLRRFSFVAPVCVLAWLIAQPSADADDGERACKVLADQRVKEPLSEIVAEYVDRTHVEVTIQYASAGDIEDEVKAEKSECDVVLCMPVDPKAKSAVESLSRTRPVAWKYPSGDPVWAAVIGEHKRADALVRFIGGPTGHLLWAESEAGFTITAGKNHAEAFDWVSENRVKHTYPLTAARMLAELGGIRAGLCIDIGCGTGNLDVELAKRSKFQIIGLDIDPDMKPLFEKRIKAAGLEDRIRFVVGDAQKLPFEDDSADVVVSRGTLTFIPDIGKCLREVDRVLKPTGIAFLGGRYLYTPQKHKISNESLREIVDGCGVPGAKVVAHRGQWVKIVGPNAPPAAHKFQAGPHMLVNRLIADYRVTKGDCLLICLNDGEGARALQRGFADVSDFRITALYPSKDLAKAAKLRIESTKETARIDCASGAVGTLPFDDGSFDLIAGTGPIMIWGDREAKLRDVYRLLRPGGVAFIGGRYLGMPDFRKVSSDDLRASVAKTGLPGIRVLDDGGQWMEIRKGLAD
jgi:ubiquinone/menaquinone biosynthesis C-methylase UbiE